MSDNAHLVSSSEGPGSLQLLARPLDGMNEGPFPEDETEVITTQGHTHPSRRTGRLPGRLRCYKLMLTLALLYA
jgi:hypothetical protein